MISLVYTTIPGRAMPGYSVEQFLVDVGCHSRILCMRLGLQKCSNGPSHPVKLQPLRALYGVVNFCTFLF